MANFGCVCGHVVRHIDDSVGQRTQVRELDDARNADLLRNASEIAFAIYPPGFPVAAQIPLTDPRGEQTGQIFSPPTGT